MSTFCECTCCHHDYTHTALLQPDLATGHTAYAAKLMAPLSIGRLQSSDASGDVKIEIGTGESTTTCPGGGDTSTSTNCPFSGAGPQSPPVNENIWLRDSKDGVNIGDGPDDVDPSTFNALAAIHFIGISYTFGKLLGPLSVAEQWRAKVGGVEGIMERETLRANRSQILVYAMLFIVVCRLDVLGLVPLTAAELVCAAAVATAIYGALILCAVLLSSFRVADADNDLKRLIANAAKPRLHASAFLVLLYMLLLVAVQAGGFGLWVHGHAAALGVLALVYAPDTLGGVQAGGAPRTSTRTFASTLSSLGLGLGPLTAACFGLISPPQLATALGFGVATVLLFGTLKPSLRGWGRDAMQCMMVSAGCQAALFMWVLFPVLGMPLLAYFGSDGSEWALPTAKLWGDWATCVRTVVMSHLTFVLTLPCVLELCDSQCSVAGIHVHSLIPAYLSLFFRVPWLVLSLDITRVASLLTAVAGIVPVWTYQSSKLSNSVRMLCREQVDAKHLAFEVGFCAFVTFFRNFVANSIFLTFVRPLLKFVNTIQADFLVYYAHPYPILNFDKISSNNIDVGIAFLVTPQDDQLQPTVFNCNVGHIADGYDWTKSNRWNYKMMKHLAEDPQAGSKGFVSDLVCEFPYNLINETRSWRQINFSAWSSSKSSRDWYHASTSHREARQGFKSKSEGGSLKTFSAMLGKLTAAENYPLRWVPKCHNCHELVLDFPQNKVCKCGNEVSMPFF